MNDADKAVNPQYFGSNPADIRIQIRINPEIRIRIPDHFRLLPRKFDRRLFLLNYSCERKEEI